MGGPLPPRVLGRVRGQELVGGDRGSEDGRLQVSEARRERREESFFPRVNQSSWKMVSRFAKEQKGQADGGSGQQR